jgi:hypothetical protein
MNVISQPTKFIILRFCCTGFRALFWNRCVTTRFLTATNFYKKLCFCNFPGPRLYGTLCNKLDFLSFGVVSPPPNPHSGGPPLSAVHDCLFSIFAYTLHIWRLSPPSASWGCAMLWWQGAHLTEICVHCS